MMHSFPPHSSDDFASDGYGIVPFDNATTSSHSSSSSDSASAGHSISPGCSISQCVNLAIRNELPTIQRLALSTEVDLDDVPGESANPQSQQAIHTFLHQLIESAKPQSHLAITLVNGNSQWELEVAAEFAAAEATEFAAADKLCSPGPLPSCDTLREMAFACGGEVEQWDCPQGGQAIVLVVSKHHRGSGQGMPSRRAA